MHVIRHRNFDSLSASGQTTWNDLARKVPFRRWDWLEAWWRNYGLHADGSSTGKQELYVLTVHDNQHNVMGIAPWYRHTTRSGSRVVRFLGDGEVCSDYLSVLCSDENSIAVTQALASWLVNANRSAAPASPGDPIRHDDRWDRLEFVGPDAADAVFNCFLAQLQNVGNLVHFCPAMNTWRLELPPTWDELLSRLSKQHRNRLRRADRIYFQSGQIQIRRSIAPDDCAVFFDILLDLHQRRWRHKGLPGAFASPRFSAFHREISARWAAHGLATLSWLEMDDKPLAVEYRLHGDGVMYAYQSGMDTQRLELRPGELANMVAVRSAIEQKQHHYDFLRGDEEYKSRWRAEPRPMLAVRVIPPFRSARLRHQAWVAGQNVKQWIKRSARLANNLRQPATNPLQTATVGDST
ncbi:MAG TPA: GNAT family N-acetyltransferase [Pirellulales bacterium]|jgi:CelD/BcsL family acetyltransferase involved in cellulose biosynthesis